MPFTEKYNCLVILGPTASGKTQFACEMAARLDGEVISADSRQVYTGLNIGTGKDLDIYQQTSSKIPYHLIDIVSPDEQFFLHQFTHALLNAFTDISSRKKLPIICGGTGLYLDALHKDFKLTQIGENDALRRELLLLSKEELLLRINNYDKVLTKQVDKNSIKRLIRGIEIAEYLKEHPAELHSEPLPYWPFYLGVSKNLDDRKKAISDRLRSRLEQGLIAEVEQLIANGLSHHRLQTLGLEYKFVSQYLLGQLNKEELFLRLETAIFQFAKRQMTWFRKMEKEGVKIYWLDPDKEINKLNELLLETGFIPQV